MGRAIRRRPLPSTARWIEIIKLIAPPQFAVLLLTILILIPSVAGRIGDYAFLVLTYLYLFFYPQGPIGEHVEKVLINLLTCAIGQGITCLFVCIAIWIDGRGSSSAYSSDGSRALGAVVLACCVFLGGVVQSRYPRFKLSTRIFLFSAAWSICTGASTINSTIFTHQFYPAALAAATSLAAALCVFPHSSQDDFADVLVRVFQIERELVEQAVSDFFALKGDRKPSLELATRRKELLEASTYLCDLFKSAQLEVNYGRLALMETKPLVASVKRTRGWINCGMGLGTREACDRERSNINPNVFPSTELEGGVAPEDNWVGLEEFRPSIFRLLQILTHSLDIVRASVELTMRGGSPELVRKDERWDILFDLESPAESKKPSLALLRQRQKVAVGIEAFKRDLASVLQHLSADSRKGRQVSSRDMNRSEDDEGSPAPPQLDHGMFRSDIYDVAFLMVSLLHITEEVESNLITCQTMVALWHGQRKRRIFFPSVTMSSWLKSKFSRDGHTGYVFRHEAEEAERRDMFDPTQSEMEKLAEEEKKGSHYSLRFAWSHRVSVLRWRIRLSTFLVHLKHSGDLRYALKLATGVVLLSLPAWLSSSRQWFEEQRGVWLIVSYIWVLETSTGAMIRISLYRAIATIASAVWAIVAYYICAKGNRYGIGLFIILAHLPAAYCILFTKHAQSLGVVFGFTQSVILLYHLTPAGSGSTETVVNLSIIRGYQILLGIVAAFLVNMFIWPLHARVYLLRTIARITRQCSTAYLSLARQMLNYDIIIGPETTKKFTKLEDNIQTELMAGQQYLDIMTVELSLVPKPVHTLNLLLQTLQRVADLLVLLRKCREVALRIIQKEACFNVLNLRKELVSNLLLSFWILGQSLVTKERLPQFLPSCRAALTKLTMAMKEEIEANPPKVQLSTLRRHNAQDNDADELEEDQGRGHDQEGSDIRPANATSIVPFSSAHFALSKSSSSYRRPHSGHQTPKTPPSRTQERVIDYSYFFIFAEHTMLSEIIYEVEKLLFLAKLLVGESSFIDTQYLPRNSQSHPYDSFDPRAVASQDLHAFHNSMSEHGIDGRRLVSQLEAQLRAQNRSEKA